MLLNYLNIIKTKNVCGRCILFIWSFLLLFPCCAFSNDEICGYEYENAFFFKECRLPWVLSDQKDLQDDYNSTEVFCQNHINAWPNNLILELEKDFVRTETEYEGEENKSKKTFKDNKGALWMMDSYENTWAKKEIYILNDNIIGALYVLMLGKRAPNIQLIKGEDGVFIGSEFIPDFRTFKEVITNFHYRKKCLAAYRCNDQFYDNISLVVSAMILLKEFGAQGKNTGQVCDEEKRMCSMAKIDHDTSKLTPPRDNYELMLVSYSDSEKKGDGFGKLEEINLKKLANNLCERCCDTSGDNYRYNDILQNSYDLAFYMGVLASIPNEFWHDVISKRIDAGEEVIGAVDVINPDNLAQKYEQIKIIAAYFSKCLFLEGAILRDDVSVIKKQRNLWLNIYDKYTYINIPHNGTPLTPLEMTVKAKKQKVIEYLYLESNGQLKTLGIMEAIRSKNSEAFEFFVKEDPEIMHNVKYRQAVIKRDWAKMFKRFLNGNDVNRKSPDLMQSIFENESVKCFDILFDAQNYTPEERIEQLEDIVTKNKDELKFEIIEKYLELLKDADADRIKEVVSLLVKNRGTYYLCQERDILKSIMKKVDNDSFFIEKSIKSENYCFVDNVANHFITPESSYLVMLQKILFDERVQTKIIKEYFIYDLMMNIGWGDVFQKIIQSPYIDENDIVKILMQKIEDRNEFADLIVSYRDFSIDALEGVEFINIPIRLCHKLIEKYVKVAYCDEDIEIIGTAKNNIKFLRTYPYEKDDISCMSKKGEIICYNTGHGFLDGVSAGVSVFLNSCLKKDLQSEVYEDLVNCTFSKNELTISTKSIQAIQSLLKVN